MTTVQYGGTAGGAAAGLHALLGPQLVNGIDYYLELTGFSKALEIANIVFTGEGTIDEQTLQGKGPFGVAVKAKEKGIPVIGLAGNVPIHPSDDMHHYFTAVFSICNA